MTDSAELSLVVRTKQGAEIVLQGLGEVAMKRKPVAKPKIKVMAGTTARRTVLTGVR